MTTLWWLFFFEILSDLNEAVPNHLADELTRLIMTLVCKVIRHRLVQVRQNLKKDFSGWQPSIAFLYLFLFHSLLRLTSSFSQYKNLMAWSALALFTVTKQGERPAYEYPKVFNNRAKRNMIFTEPTEDSIYRNLWKSPSQEQALPSDIYLTKEKDRCNRCGDIFGPVPVEKKREESKPNRKSRHDCSSRVGILALAADLCM